MCNKNYQNIWSRPELTLSFLLFQFKKKKKTEAISTEKGLMLMASTPPDAKLIISRANDEGN